MRLICPIATIATALLLINPATGAEQDPLPEPGLHQLELGLDGGGSLRYSLYVPKTGEGEKVPLVLALHYGGEVTPYYSTPFLRVFALPAFRPLNCVIVAPDCPGRGWSDPVSEAAVLELLDHAVTSWQVDPERIAVTGFSMGGSGAWFMAARHPERFSAAIPVAGTAAWEPDPAVPVYAIHSRQDDIVDLAPAEQAIEKLRAEGGHAELVLIGGATHYQTPRFVVPLITAARWLEHLWSGADYADWEKIKKRKRSLIDDAGRPPHEPKVDLKIDPAQAQEPAVKDNEK